MGIYKNKSLQNIEGEVWVDMIGYETIYMCSSMGRIKANARINSVGKMKKEKIMAQSLWKGYLSLSLTDSNGVRKSQKSHRIIGKNFVPNPNNLPEINHLKGIRHDNRASELGWSTHKDNIQHAYDFLGKITPMKGKFGKDCPNSKKVKCNTLDITFTSVTEAAMALGLGITTISEICVGKSPHAYGMVFSYI